MARVIWKGAITFGLVHVPVALYPASQEAGIDFDWLDKRSMDPVGYKRINKRTGREISRENIVKGIKQESGDYVVLSDDEINAAYPKSTQTIEIETFVKASDVSFVLLEKPYFLTPAGKGEKVYALLREAMTAAGVIGIARVVMHTKERLAALLPAGNMLMLNTIRWASELRSADDLSFPPAGKAAAGLKDGELKMAAQLIGDMTSDFNPQDFDDRFTHAIHELARKKVEAGDTEKVAALEDDPAAASSDNVIDLSELLRRSLRGPKGGRDKPARETAASASEGKGAPRKVAAKSSTRGGAAGKRARKRAA